MQHTLRHFNVLTGVSETNFSGIFIIRWEWKKETITVLAITEILRVKTGGGGAPPPPPPPLIWGNTRKRRTKDRKERNRELTMMFGNLQEVNSPIKTTIN